MILGQVLHRRTINGTIDGHDPIMCTFNVMGKGGYFALTVVTCNLGRGYTAPQFQANVTRLLNMIEDREYVVLLLQEIDEADPSNEHHVLRDAILKIARDHGKEVHFVEWGLREPVAIIGNGIKVAHERKTMTMDQGTKIGAPAGTGPRRYLVTCIAVIEGVRIAIGNQHPHRYSLRGKAVTAARRRGEAVTRRVLGALGRVCDIVIDGGDMNTSHYPLSIPGQRVAYQRDLDYIRWFRRRSA